MKTIFLFDVDGTLTPAKSKIKPAFKKTFLDWCREREFYIVSGGSFERIVGQVSRPIVSEAVGVFACMANAYYKNITDNTWQLKYENKFNPTNKKKLLDALDWVVKDSAFHIKTGKHYEERTGMLNFSIVGRNANMDQRKVYEEYDAKFKERVAIVEKLSPDYPELEFVVGGAVSIDIFNTGNDKSQVITKVLHDELETKRIVFVGDRVDFPGNDYSLAKILKKHPNGMVFSVKDWKETEDLLTTDVFASG
jgi:phosphomannomutase